MIIPITKLRILQIGYWESSANAPIVNMSGDSRAQLRRNVKVSDELKPHFRVTTILERPYVMLRTNDAMGTASMSGGGGAMGERENENAKFEGEGFLGKSV